MCDCILLTDREQHPLFGSVRHHRPDSEPRASSLKGGEILLMPLEADKEITGVLSICKESAQELLSEGDLELMRILAAEASVAVKNYQSLAKVEDSCLACLRSIALLVDSKSPYTVGHMERVAHLSRQLATEIGMTADEVELVSLAASLHDMGKIGIDETALNNTDELSPEEPSLIRRHPEIADESMAPLRFLSEARTIIRHHHEQCDGQGYPDGLSGQDITPAMHVVILANAHDNLTSGRPWRPPMHPDYAIRKLQEGKGTRFDPEIIDSFVAMMQARESRE